MQWSGQAALPEPLIHRVRLFQRVRIRDHDRVNRRSVLVEGVDTSQVLFDERAAREPAGLHRVVDLRDGSFVNFKWRRRLCRRSGDQEGNRNEDGRLCHAHIGPYFPFGSSPDSMNCRTANRVASSVSTSPDCRHTAAANTYWLLPLSIPTNQLTRYARVVVAPVLATSVAPVQLPSSG